MKLPQFYRSVLSATATTCTFIMLMMQPAHANTSDSDKARAYQDCLSDNIAPERNPYPFIYTIGASTQRTDCSRFLR